METCNCSDWGSKGYHCLDDRKSNCKLRISLGYKFDDETGWKRKPSIKEQKMTRESGTL